MSSVIEFPSVTGAVEPSHARRNTGVLTLLAIASVSYALVQSMINPALDVLRSHVHTDQVGVSWLLTSFLLSSAVFTPILGRLGDYAGKRRVLVAVMTLLAVGSAVCALASNLPLLVAGRLLQGAGGATLPLAFGILRDTLPRKRVGVAVGMVAAVSSVGGAIGVLVTGPIISTLGVAWLFWVPAIANGAMAFGVRAAVPDTVRHAHARLDWQAAVALAATLVLLLVPLSLGGDWGWGSPMTIGLFAAAAAAGVLWVVIETRSDSPLIDMRVFQLRPVWTANLTSLLFGVTLYSAFGFIPAFLQVPAGTGYGLGESVTASGLLFLPMTLTQFSGGLVAGPLARRMAPKALLVAGAVPIVVGFTILAVAHREVWQVVLATAVAGSGFGISLSALSAVVVHAVPHRHTGAATGMNANIRTIGGAVGAAVVASVLAANTAASGFPTDAGYTTVFAILAVTGVLGLASCLLIPDHSQEGVA